jgi:hypothetical protein
LGKIKQLLEQHSYAERLEAYQEQLNHALEMFKVHPLEFNQCIFMPSQVRSAGFTLSQAVKMRQDAKQCHEELIALLESDSELTSGELSSVSCDLYLVTGGLRSYFSDAGHSAGCRQQVSQKN